MQGKDGIYIAITINETDIYDFSFLGRMYLSRLIC